jgi:hypothetical protein
VLIIIHLAKAKAKTMALPEDVMRTIFRYTHEMAMIAIRRDMSQAHKHIYYTYLAEDGVLVTVKEPPAEHYTALVRHGSYPSLAVGQRYIYTNKDLDANAARRLQVRVQCVDERL